MFTKPSHFSNDQDFFKAFCAELKETDSRMSMRNLCRRLNWSSSYLNDLIAGRKRLSAAKAITFATHFDFSEFEIEYLLFLVLQKSKDSQVRTFASTALAERKQGRFLEDNDDWDWMYADIDYMALYMVVCDWSGPICAQKIADKFLATPSIDIPKIEYFLTKLRDLDALQETPKGETIKSQLLHRDFVAKSPEDRAERAKLHRAYAENFIRFLDTRKSPALINSGPIRARWGDFLEYRKRVLALRNWLMTKSEELAGKHEDDVIYLQYDLNLFPICNTNPPRYWESYLRDSDDNRSETKT